MYSVTLSLCAILAVMALAFFLPKKVRPLFGLVAAILLPSLAFAQDGSAVNPDQILATVAQVLAYLGGMPKIGAILLLVLKWVSTIAGVLTALSIAVSGIMLSLSGLLKLPELVSLKILPSAPAWAEKLSKWSEAIKKVNDQVQPYLKWLSMFNVQKK